MVQKTQARDQYAIGARVRSRVALAVADIVAPGPMRRTYGAISRTSFIVHVFVPHTQLFSMSLNTLIKSSDVLILSTNNEKYVVTSVD